MQYKQELKSELWDGIRKQVYSRDGYTCRWCEFKGKGKKLNAHHKVYYNNNGKRVKAWDYPLRDLETLCETCHHIFHKVMGFSVPVIEKSTGKIINEDEPTRRTRLAVEKQIKKEKSNA